MERKALYHNKEKVECILCNRVTKKIAYTMCGPVCTNCKKDRTQEELDILAEETLEDDF
jgi:transposase-like protein